MGHRTPPRPRLGTPKGLGILTPCLCCGTTEPGKRRRGLADRCYFRHRRNGTHLDYPRTYWPRDMLLEEWEWLRSEGYTRSQAAERLGITRDRLDKAIEREQAAA